MVVIIRFATFFYTPVCDATFPRIEQKVLDTVITMVLNNMS